MMTKIFDRRSVKILISFAFLVSYAIWTFASFYYDTKSNAEAVQLRQREQMINHSQIAYLLLESGKEEHAIERLRQAKNANEITAFVLRKDGEILSGIDRQDIISHLPPSQNSVPVHGDDYSYLRSTTGPYDLIVVVNDSVRGRMETVLKLAMPLLFLIRKRPVIFI